MNVDLLHDESSVKANGIVFSDPSEFVFSILLSFSKIKEISIFKRLKKKFIRFCFFSAIKVFLKVKINKYLKENIIFSLMNYFFNFFGLINKFIEIK